MENCIFCKISRNETESKIIFEDEFCMAILAIDPVSNGHTLVIPKKHFDSMSDIEEETLKRMILITKEVGERSKKLLGATGYNLLNANGQDAQQSVFHLHFHVVPRYKNDNLDLWFNTKIIEKIELNDIFAKLKY